MNDQNPMRIVIRTLILTPGPRGWGAPAIFWSKPGQGKSDIIENIAAELGVHGFTFSPGEQGEGAFGVVPKIDKRKDGSAVLRYPTPDWMDMFEETGNRGIVFFDEINSVAELMPPLLGATHARRIGSGKFPRGVRVLAAANPPALNGGHELTAALANRFGHFDWQAPTVSEWTDWAMAHNPTVPFGREFADVPFDGSVLAHEEERVLKAWPAAYAYAKGLVIGFVRAKPGMLYRMPEEGSPELTRAWPSHRSVDTMTRVLASSRINDNDKMIESTLITGFVGSGFAKEFSEYERACDLPDPQKVLSGEVPWRHDRLRMDRSWAVLSACSSYLTSIPKPDKALVEMMWKILDDTKDSAKDLAWSAAEPLVRKNILDGKYQSKVLASLNPLVEIRQRARAASGMQS
jgi:hypothetical protein